ncbi:bifunctional folylpolyglutamate synthase/dihydrofolate synthase [Lactococcus cremoris]|uniref:bifunctional folylpolyglutamate synthase/dihydrofolate synthase n=1 Tax=Lactococcus lactis subsp. cremoris TaxID=1359 RepID=UPI00038BA7D7|nr:MULTISPECIES: folylpolyglutamate synthase/dihydrofolate synthase family protein [Lactococcus]EQC87689.1 tetrahydrofolate synthase [Lactococcus cremoris subsp. cremoris TIFN1]AXN65427.1 Folylpolyglutamate synthase [Lactococcus cremoris]KZK45152.1 Dihydrofolate synthase Folylpolyglutamate synthase [Lactococcus cremoris]MRM50538.1 bifunctional folylpolyglutamate synthase/dihydrofolate synthase [Lactococcus cremoris]OAJ97396.1 tetrahydrofolate synthase [Lactococcus lactis]
MSIEQALEWIHSRLKFNIRPGLNRVSALLELLGNPEESLSMIHIAGTNGKGSTVAFTRSIFMQAGLKVASFTSPFITTFGERMSINAQPIPDEKLIYYVKMIQPLVEKLDNDAELTGITEFEIITAMAFKYFADEKVDLAVIEVGLGGLLDSTNVIRPVVSGITTIGLDHIDILGSTIEEIAAQKAGIIKAGIPVVVGNIELKALRVIWEVARKNTARIYQYPYDYRTELKEHEHFDFFASQEAILDLEKSLIGLHQVENAGMAIELALVYANKVGINLNEEIIRAGIREAFWPARMEKLGENPLILLDGAHNVHAMNRLLENLGKEFPDKKITIIFSAITTKDIRQMIKMLQTVKNSRLILTTFDYPKALDLKDFRYLEDEGVKLAPSWELVIVRAQKALNEDELLLITGSLYFSSQVREFLKKEK